MKPLEVTWLFDPTCFQVFMSLCGCSFVIFI